MGTSLLNLPRDARTQHLRLRCRGKPKWYGHDIGLLDRGPVLARIHEFDGDYRDPYLEGMVTPGRYMQVSVNITQGMRSRRALVGKEVFLEPPEDEPNLPIIPIRLDQPSTTRTVKGRYEPKLLLSNSGKTIYLRQTEYYGDFKFRVTMTGRIPYGKDGDQVDASDLSDDGKPPEWTVRGNCQYKILYNLRNKSGRSRRSND